MWRNDMLYRNGSAGNCQDQVKVSRFATAEEAAGYVRLRNRPHLVTTAEVLRYITDAKPEGLEGAGSLNSDLQPWCTDPMAMFVAGIRIDMTDAQVLDLCDVMDEVQGSAPDGILVVPRSELDRLVDERG